MTWNQEIRWYEQAWSSLLSEFFFFSPHPDAQCHINKQGECYGRHLSAGACRGPNSEAKTMIQSRTMLILACLLFLVATRGPASGQPPRRYLADTVPDGSGGFLYHFYDVFDTPLDWASAHAFAQTLLDPVAGHTVGTVSHLVAIDSQKENDFVQGIINGDSWIGLTDRVGVSQNSPLGTVVVPATEGNWNWTLTHPINALGCQLPPRSLRIR